MKKVILLIGPTGVGKTSVSILIAKTLHSEIISADSMQVYRHMDIGTAKPSVDEQRQIKHHLIDVVEPWESFSTGQYITAVVPLIDRLLEDGKTPLVTGGTGLYIKAMTRGIFSGPSADWKLRNEFIDKERDDPGYLYKSLKSLDPGAASRIMPGDTRRIIRAMEVCLKSSSTMTAQHQMHTKPLPYEFVKIGLTRDRKELYRLIDERVDQMMERGLLKEAGSVIELIKSEGHRQLPIAGSTSPLVYSSMQAIGYKEMAMHLNGEISLVEATALIKQRSRNYAKRQFTWFRKEAGIKWIDMTGIFDTEEMCGNVLQIISAC
ncbi:MAG: tRNA (adenosine(37)-N6)-dimethylallyltransferase MiaA [Nitrospirae bacterium]|nr:tRNA (adenosine(37)-N6)-dimethylallyltransferase MiaA [Nitrospirota bacterium]